ncbi:MAG: hypothetical protein ABIW82_02495 [Dokdonella sp.]
MHRTHWVSLAFLIVCSLSQAATTVRLPASTCPASDTLFWNGFENSAIPNLASNGSGGAYPGDIERTVTVPVFGARTYYLHVPPNYTPAHAWPMLLALHGSSPSSAVAAQAIRADWSTIADSGGFIVIAAASNGTGWGNSDDLAEIQSFLADAFASYNIEQSRVYLWGFSSGGHYGHWYALNHTDFFAAYSVSAGALQLYTCTDSGSPNCATVLTGVPRKIPVDIHIGNTDPLYTHPEWDVKHDDDRFASGGWVKGRDLFFVVFGGAHTYTVPQLGQIWNNLCPFAVGP